MVNEKSKIILNYYITFILILASGTIYASYVFYKEFVFFLLINGILLNRLKPIKLEKLLIFIAICVIVLLNFYTYQQNVDGYIALVIKMLAILLICNAIDIRYLYKSYVNIIFIISIVSLFCYFTWIMKPDWVMSNIPVTEVWGSAIRATPFYTFPYMGIDRNFGPFKEAGMYQIFLNIGLFLVLKYDVKYKKLKSLIFLITIITTFSTAGLITTFILIGYFLIQGKNFMKNKSLIILTLLFFMIGLWAENEYGIISDKMSSENASYTARSSEFEITARVLANHPLVGVGYQNNYYNLAYGFIESGTNGVLALYQQFGVFFASIMLLFYFKGIRSLSNSFLELSVLFFMIFISFSTEPTMFQPLFLIILFHKIKVFKKEEKVA
ncbi:hypothetical protein [Priestia megaterium]|uniref:hypothetical protein n=1 Tax=Priestia megaterium TaxID=1404 RepID=UPI002E9C687A|nr:hypothetical protein [Priestia megaterium]